MYVAIVFLPLLGAIIAGAIALIGARNRLPGADPPPPDARSLAASFGLPPQPPVRFCCYGSPDFQAWPNSARSQLSASSSAPF